MEQVFGANLCKWKEMEGDDVTDVMKCQSVPTSEVLNGDTKYIGVLFTANYCPPCHALLEPLQNFYNEFKPKGFEIVMVNCDRNEQNYAELLKEHEFLHALPFNCEDSIIEELEDKAYANVIPKLAVYSVQKGFKKCVVQDIKNKVLKNSSMAEAVDQVLEKIADGEAEYDRCGTGGTGSKKGSAYGSDSN